MRKNTGFEHSMVSPTSWGEGASLALFCHPNDDKVTTKTPYGADVSLRQPSLHSIFFNGVA